MLDLDGTVTQVGSATRFGADVAQSNGLAVIGSTVWMLSQNKLYNISINTGIATLFHTFSETIQHIASVNNQLYVMSDSKLYRLTSNNTVLTRVGTSVISGISAFCGMSDGFLYAMGRYGFYKINPTTGASTQITTYQDTFFGTGRSEWYLPYALGEFNGDLLAVLRYVDWTIERSPGRRTVYHNFRLAAIDIETGNRHFLSAPGDNILDRIDRFDSVSGIVQVGSTAYTTITRGSGINYALYRPALYSLDECD